MLKGLLYSPQLSPIAVPEGYEDEGVEACDLAKEGIKLKSLAESRPLTKSND